MQEINRFSEGYRFLLKSKGFNEINENFSEEDSLSFKDIKVIF